MHHFPELLIIGGTGRNSGKTTLACLIIERFRRTGVIAVKISPHTHDDVSGVPPLVETGDYSIYTEQSTEGDKDSSRMLKAGASVSYYIQANNESAVLGFLEVMKLNTGGLPVICESPSIRLHIKPALFIITDNPDNDRRKDPGTLLGLANLIVTPGVIHSVAEKIEFKGGYWSISLT